MIIALINIVQVLVCVCTRQSFAAVPAAFLHVLPFPFQFVRFPGQENVEEHFSVICGDE